MKKAFWVAIPLWCGVVGLHAQLVINDQLSGASSSYPWQSIGGACLTAGDDTGTLPSCLSQNRMVWPPDPVGQGALRLTDAAGNQTGGVISQATFPSDQGLEVTFTALSYGGNGLEGTGADGLSFFLIDADVLPTVNASTQLGARGGSLGYSRSRAGFAGMQGGYLGLGIDAFGNFSNPNDNGRGGPGRAPNSIALRGAQSTGYRYISGSRVLGQIATTGAQSRGDAVPLTFNLSISRDGLLNLVYSRHGGVANPVISNHPITQSNGVLPRNFHFGFAASTGDGTNIHEITCFKASSITESGSSAASNLLQSAKVQLGTQLFLAYYHTQEWWGQLTAQNILMDPVSKQVSINPVANWDAHCQLTGGFCKASQTLVQVQGPEQRSILSFNGKRGVPFRGPRLAVEQLLALDPDPDMPRIDYLRGDRSGESQSAQAMRTRAGVLGDISNSSPTWVGPPQQPYAGYWKDALYPAMAAAEGNSYLAFARAKATRTNVVYVGANDGMLHGFRTGAFNAQGVFDAKVPNDGRELLAYVPAAVLSSLHSSVAQLDFSGQQYAHNAFVDATPGVGDLYYAGAWHTWLVSGLGAGGNPAGVIADNTSAASGSIFALDVTDPELFDEAHAAALVVGEWNAATLRCVGDSASARCGEHLGNTYGTPVIRRLHNGRWAALFGNGYNSQAGTAGVYLMIADGAEVRFRYLDTGVGSSTERNGIAYVTPVDLDGDQVLDYLYAGDLQGNVWRFDLSSADPADWHVRAAPLFQTGGPPITTQIMATPVSDGAGGRRLMLNFGSGRILPQTLSSGAVPDPRGQALFGVWDWDMASWNQHGSPGFLSQSAYDSYLVPRQTLRPADLRLQTISTNTQYVQGAIHGLRTITQDAICWRGGRVCPGLGSNNQFGWRAPLPGRLEQVVYNPVMQDGVFLVSTVIPAPALSCSATAPAAGFTMALTPDQGIAPEISYFHDAVGADPALGQVAGIGLSAVGTPSHVTADGVRYMVTQTSSGEPILTRVNPPAITLKVKRLTWLRMR